MEINSTHLYTLTIRPFTGPVKEDINSLVVIQNDFRKVISLKTNFQKTLLSPIRCHDLNLSGVLQNLWIVQTTFSLLYFNPRYLKGVLKGRTFQYLNYKDCQEIIALAGQGLYHREQRHLLRLCTP